MVDLLTSLFPDLKTTATREIADVIKQTIKRIRVEGSHGGSPEFFTTRELVQTLCFEEIVALRLKNASKSLCSIELVPLNYSEPIPSNRIPPSKSKSSLGSFVSPIFWKSSKWISPWRSRILKADFSSQYGLQVYKKEGDPLWKSVAFQDIRSVSIAPADFDAGRDFSCLIHTEQATWIFACESAEIAQTWVEKIATLCLFFRVLHFKPEASGNDQLHFDQLAAVKRLLQNGARVDQSLTIRPDVFKCTLIPDSSLPVVACCILDIALTIHSATKSLEMKRIIQAIIESEPEKSKLSRAFLNYQDGSNFALIGTTRDVVQQLLRLNLPVDVQSTDDRGWTFLMHLCTVGDFEAVKELVDVIEPKDKYCQLKNSDGNSAIALALLTKQTTSTVKCCEYLAPYMDINVCNGAGDTLLHLCLRSLNDLSESFATSLILEHAADLTAVDHAGNTPLHLTLLQHNYIIARQIILQIKQNRKLGRNLGTGVLSPRGFGSKVAVPLWDLRERKTQHTVMTLALQQDQHALCEELLELGASADVEGVLWNSTNTAQDWPLHVALKAGLSHIAEKLIDCGAEITRSDNSGDSPLAIALRHGMFSTAYRIICLFDEEKPVGTPVTMKDAIQALEHGQMELFPLLMDRTMGTHGKSRLLHAMIQSREVSSTALHSRTLSGIFKTVLNSETYDIDLNASHESETALQLLARLASDDAIGFFEQLLKHKDTSICQTNDEGESVLIIAIRSRWVAGVKAILSHDDSGLQDVVNTAGDSPLHIAVVQVLTATTTDVQPAMEIFQLLLKAEANALAWDAQYRCPIHVCVLLETESNSVAVQSLIEIYAKYRNGNCLDIRSSSGDTPLMLAVTYGHNTSVNTLLDCGAELRLQHNESRATALHMLLSSVKGKSMRINSGLVERIIAHTSSLSRASLDCVKNAEGQSMSDALLELTELLPQLPQMSPRRTESNAAAAEYIETRESKRNSIGSPNIPPEPQLSSRELPQSHGTERPIGSRLCMDRSEIENFVLSCHRGEERMALKVVATEAQETASEWLKKRSGKQRIRTNALLLLQQNDLEDQGIKSEADAMEIARKVSRNNQLVPISTHIA